jgi:hypothetical protein
MKSNDIDRMLDIFVGGHTFNQTYWPHVKMVAWNEMFLAERFCYDNFKTRNWRNRGQHFGFKRKEDFEWFVLRWS